MRSSLISYAVFCLKKKKLAFVILRPVKALTVRATEFPAATAGAGAAEVKAFSPAAVTSPTKFVDFKEVKSARPELTEARVVVATAIVRNREVLAQQRSYPVEAAGRWEPPGGRVEPGGARGAGTAPAGRPGGAGG